MTSMNKNSTITEKVSIEAMLKTEEYQNTEMKLPCILGVTENNKPFLFDLTKCHMLIAGTPGQGMRNVIHSILLSLLHKKSPSELKLVLIDSRMVEFAEYEPLATQYLAKMPYMEEPIISDMQDAVNAINSLRKLMDVRYEFLLKNDARNIEDYNDKYKKGLISSQPFHGIMPYYVVMIDDYGDYMMTVGKEFELPLAMLAQLARAVGIYIVIATPRPVSRVINGTIKANFPCRIATKVMSELDSKLIINKPGAERLSDTGLSYVCDGEHVKIQSVHVDEFNDVPHACRYLASKYPDCSQTQLPVDKNFEKKKTELSINKSAQIEDVIEKIKSNGYTFEYSEPLLEKAAKTVVEMQSTSISILQRKLCIGYNRASRLMDLLETIGLLNREEPHQ